MVSLIAPPELFSAYAFSVDDEGVEPDLGKGTHLRLYAGLGPSFPLTPFVVHRLRSSSSEPRRTHFSDRYGEYVPDPDLGEHEVLDVTLEHGDDDWRRTVRVDLYGAIDGATLLDQHDRVIGERREAPWLYSAPVLHKARVWGGSGGVSVSTRSVHVGAVLELGDQTPRATLGLPIEGRHPWYVGIEDRDAAMWRVEHGAPRRLNPMDLPFGPFDGVDPTDEVARVEKMLDAMQLGGGLEDLVTRIVNDEERVPWRQRDLEELPVETGAKQFVNSYRLATLQTAAIDPGLARFLGFADRIDDLPDLSEGWDTLAIIGLFALSPRAYARYNVDFYPLLQNPAPGAQVLLDLLIHGLEVASGRDLRDEILDLRARVRDHGLVAEPFVTFAAPVPPYLPPELPEPEVVQRRWQGTRGDAPSELYRASFAFPNVPLVSMSALARDAGDGWVSRHEMLDVSGLQRATPGILGRELEPNSRLNELNPMVKIQETAGLLSDHDIPADAGSATFSMRASDFFGRFGDERVTEIEPPARPMPPPPILRFHIQHAQLDSNSTAAVSPGVLRLTIAVPRPWPARRHFGADDEERLGAAIVVPRLDNLAPGALPLSRLELEIGGRKRAFDLSFVGIRTWEMPLPQLHPQETATWTLSGRFFDSDGNPSALAELPVMVTDGRPPKVYPTGVGLFWTSAPGPSPEVESKLSWPAKSGSRHRVYLTDQAGLGISDEHPQLSSTGAPPSRGLIAAVGCRKVINGDQIDKAGFRLLTDEPVVANTDNEVVYDVRLPRSLQTVQFLRVVPLGPDGGEPPFEKCGIVPIAVPESRRPPAPLLGGEVDPATGHARLTITTEGFDLVALKRDETGLFQPGEPGTEPPQAFVRRAVGEVADPIYARPLGPAAMSIADAATERFSATIADTNGGRGLEPFVRYVYWAQVRLPPERRLPAGYAEVNPTGGIGPVDSGARKSHKRPMSLPSAPRTLMHTPPTPPAAPEAAQVEISRIPAPIDSVGLRIKLADPPEAHAKAVDQYRLAVWVQWPGRAIDPITNGNGAALNGMWPTMAGGVVTTVLRVPAGADPSATLTVRLGFVDPIGRMGDLWCGPIPADQ